MGRYGDEIAGLATPLRDPGYLDELLERIAGATVVMLGEASHGTHEFYWWRAALTERLLAEYGYSFVAVDGDWPGCARVDHAVRWRKDQPAEDPRTALGDFARWPAWMWANEEVADFARWLHRYNTAHGGGEQVGFHGLDVYSLRESLREIILYLRERDPELVPAALAAYRCFEPVMQEPPDNPEAARFVPMSCENEVVDLLVELSRRHVGDLELAPNAKAALNAERYYRAMIAGGPQAWNVRDRHMDDTLARLLRDYGPRSKAVVWAHNTHIGDARATNMVLSGEVSLGQLARQRYGPEKVALVGFGTHHGTVTAADAWGAPPHALPVAAARPGEGALEHVLHLAAPLRAALVFPRGSPREDRPALLTDWLDHRAIGTLYDPEAEHRGNYVPSVLGDRYDAFCWFDETSALAPLPVGHAGELEFATSGA